MEISKQAVYILTVSNKQKVGGIVGMKTSSNNSNSILADGRILGKEDVLQLIE